MSMQTTSDNASGDPMLDMNVTPLIDVMLVLLIMFIITIPVQTHAVKLDLPVNQPNQPPPPIQPLKNTVVVSADGNILWNGQPVSQPQLRQYLDTTQQMNPIPELHLQPDATAKYALVDEVLAITKRAHVQKMGFVGNEYYAQGIF
jgi:biopolymer transport protein ExbD